MNLRNWEQIILEWANSLNLVNSRINGSKDLSSGDFLGMLIKHFLPDDTGQMPVMDFMKVHYPEYIFENEPTDTYDSLEVTLLCSVLIHYCCIKDTKLRLRDRMCMSLSGQTQIYIKDFLEALMTYSDITRTSVTNAITSVIADTDLPSTPKSQRMTPFKSNKSSPLSEFFKATGGRSSSDCELHGCEIRKLRSQLAVDQYEKEYLQDEIKQLQEKYKSLETQANAKMHELSSIKAELAELQGRSPKYVEKHSTHNSEKRLRADINELETYIKKLHTEQAKLADEKERAQKKLQQTEHECLEWQTKALSAEQMCTRLEQKSLQETEQLIQLRSQCDELNSILTEYRSRDKHNESDDWCTGNQTATCSENLADAVVDVLLKEEKQHVVELEHQLNDIVQQKGELEAEISTLRQQLLQAEDRHLCLQRDNCVLFEKISILEETQKKLEHAERSLRDLQADLTRSNEDNMVLDKNVRRLENELTLSDTNIRELQDLNNNLTADFQSLEDQHKTLAVNYETCKNDCEYLNGERQNLQMMLETKMKELKILNAEIGDVKNTFDAFNSSIENYLIRLESLVGESPRSDDKIEKFRILLDELENKNIVAAANKSELEELCGKLEKEGNKLRDELTKAVESDQLNAVKVQELKASLISAQNKILEYETLCADHTRRIDTLRECLQEKETLISNLENEKDFIINQFDTHKNETTKEKQIVYEKLKKICKETKALKSKKDCLLKEVERLKRVHEKDVAKLTGNHEVLTTSLQSIQSENREVRQELEGKDSDLARLRVELEEYVEDRKQLTTEIEHMEAEVVELKGARSLVEHELVVLGKQKDVIESIKNDLQERFDAANQRHAAQLLEMDAKIEQLTLEKGKAENCLRVAAVNLQTMEQTINEKNTEIEERSLEVLQLKTELKELKTKLDEINNEKTGLLEELRQIKDDFECSTEQNLKNINEQQNIKCHLEEEIKSLTLQIEDLSAKCTKLVDVSALTQKQLDSVSAETESLHRIKESLEKQLGENQCLYINVNGINNDLVSKLEKLDSEYTKYRAIMEFEIQEHKSKLSDLEKVKANAESQIDKLDEEKHHFLVEIEKLKTEISALVKAKDDEKVEFESQLKQYKEKHEKLLNERDTLTMSLQVYKKDKITLETELDKKIRECEEVAAKAEEDFKLWEEKCYSLERSKSKLETAIQVVEEAKENLELELKKTNNDLAAVEASSTKLIEDHKTELALKEAIIDDLTEQLGELQVVVATVKVENNKLQYNLKETSDRAEAVETEKRKLEELIEETWLECEKQKQSQIEAHETKLDEMRTQFETTLKDVNEEKLKLQLNIEHMTSEVVHLRDRLDSSDNVVHEKLNEIIKHNDYIKELVVKLQTLENEKVDLIRELEKTSSELSKIEKDRNELVETHKTLISEHENQLLIAHEQFKRDLAEHLHQNSNLEVLLSNEKHKCDSLQKHLSILETEKQEIIHVCNELRAAIAKIFATLKDTGGQGDFEMNVNTSTDSSSLEMLNVLNENLTEVQKQIQNAVRLKEELCKQIDGCEYEKLHYENKLDELYREKSRMDEHSVGMVKKIKELNAERLMLQAERDKFQVSLYEYENIKSDREKLSKENSLLVEKQEELQTEVKTLQNKVSEIMELNNNLIKSKQQVVENEMKAQNTIQSLEKNIKELLSTNISLSEAHEQKIHDLNEQMSQLKRENLENNSKIDELKRGNRSSEKTLKELNHDLQEWKNKYDNKCKEAGKLERTVEEWETKYDDKLKEKNMRIQEVKELYDGLLKHNDALLKQRDVTKHQHDSLLQQYNSLHSEFNECQAKQKIEIDTLRYKITREREEHKREIERAEEAFKKEKEKAIIDARKKDEAEFKKEMEGTVLEVRKEYELKLESMKKAMIDLCKDEVKKYIDQLEEVRNQSWKTNEKYLSVKREKEEAVKELLALKMKSKSSETESTAKEVTSYLPVRKATSTRTHSETQKTAATLPRQVKSAAMTRNPPPAFTRPKSSYEMPPPSNMINKSERANSTARSIAGSLHMEDEEGEVFNNTYLADMKAGRCSVASDRESKAFRLSELQKRNSMVPPHLKSSYPAETQFNSPGQFKEDELKLGNLDFDDSLTSSLIPSEKSKNPSYKKPGPPTPSKNGGRQSLQGNESHVLREQNDNTKTPRPRMSTPNRIKQLFMNSTSSRHGRDSENQPGTPKGRRMSIFRKPR